MPGSYGIRHSSEPKPPRHVSSRSTLSWAALIRDVHTTIRKGLETLDEVPSSFPTPASQISANEEGGARLLHAYEQLEDDHRSMVILTETLDLSLAVNDVVFHQNGNSIRPTQLDFRRTISTLTYRRDGLQS